MVNLFNLILFLLLTSQQAMAGPIKLGYGASWTNSSFVEDSQTNLSVPGIADSRQTSAEKFFAHTLNFAWQHPMLRVASFKVTGEFSTRWAFAGDYQYTVGNKTSSADLEGGLGLGYAAQLEWQAVNKLRLGMEAGLFYQRIGGAATPTSIFPYQSYTQAFTVQSLYPRFGLLAQYDLPAPFRIQLMWDFAWLAFWQSVDYTILSQKAKPDSFSQQQLGLNLVYVF